MARPTLPLAAQVDVERVRENLISHLITTCDLLFGPKRQMLRMGVGGRPPTRQPATLISQLGAYATTLFDAAAIHYVKLSDSDPALQSWLEDLAESVTAEVMTEHCTPDYDFHCPYAERKDAIGIALKERISYWMKRAESDYDATLGRGRAAIERWERTRRQAELPTRAERIEEAPHPTAPEPSIQKRASTRRAYIDPLLEKHGWTPNGWATKAGLHPSIIYEYLRGKSNPRAETRRTLAQALGVGVSELPR
jgi:hypothetical protein